MQSAETTTRVEEQSRAFPRVCTALHIAGRNGETLPEVCSPSVAVLFKSQLPGHKLRTQNMYGMGSFIFCCPFCCRHPPAHTWRGSIEEPSRAFARTYTSLLYVAHLAATRTLYTRVVSMKSWMFSAASSPLIGSNPATLRFSGRDSFVAMLLTPLMPPGFPETALREALEIGTRSSCACASAMSAFGCKHVAHENNECLAIPKRRR